MLARARFPVGHELEASSGNPERHPKVFVSSPGCREGKWKNSQADEHMFFGKSKLTCVGATELTGRKTNQEVTATARVNRAPRCPLPSPQPTCDFR